MDTAVLLLLLGMMSCAVAFAVFLLVMNNKPPKTPPEPPPKPPKTPPKPPKTPPGTPPKPPKTPPGTPPKPPTGNGGGGLGKHLQNEDDLFAQVKANSEALKAHLRKNYGSHANTRLLLQNFRVLKKMPNVGMRKQWWGVTIGTTVEVKVDEGLWKQLPDVNNTLVHELGHSITLSETADHGPKFRAAYMWLANIASKDLGWQIGIDCNICQTYRICDRAVCPKCRWCYRGRASRYSDNMLGN